MQGRVLDSRFRNTIVCVDQYNDKVLVGRLYNPYFNGAVPFKSAMQFVEIVEGMFEEMKFPQAYEAKRVFAKRESEERVVKDFSPEDEGKLATFELKVLFRQNASWQGTLSWLERGYEESFRSVLELLILMDSALMENR